MAATKVDQFGRIVIPKGIRVRLGLKRGSVLEVDESEDGILLRPERAEPPLRVRDGVLVFTGAPVGELDHALERHREERLRDVAEPVAGSKR